MALNLGQLYEQKIQRILRKEKLLPDLLQGNDAGFFHNQVPYFVEVKNAGAPDFGQKGLIWDKITNSWKWREDDIVSQLFDALGVKNHIKSGFEPRRYTVEPIDKITKADREYDQQNFKKSGIPLGNLTYLYEFYARKQCYYIQIEGKGFFYLKQDYANLRIANLNLPQFVPELTLRLRAKTHHSDPPHNYSFFAVIQAKTGALATSPFDLEGKVGKFPKF